MLEVSEIKRLIDNDINSEKKTFAAIGQRYYEANHDIKDYRLFYYNADGDLVEDTTRSNIKISHPFFTELADQLTPYVLSNSEDIIYSDIPELNTKLKVYFDEEFWAEMAEVMTGGYVKGFDYAYGYKDEDGKLHFKHADAMGVVEVRAKDTDTNSEHYIYWYIDRIDKGKKEIRRIQVHTDKDVTYYVQSGANGKITMDDSEPINPRPNVIYMDKKGKKFSNPKGLGFIPFFRFDYNRKQISGLKPIKGLIDDYDLHACSLSNNLKDFDTPIHVVKGFAGDSLDELQQNLKTKKIVGVDEGGGIEVATVNIPYRARKEKLDIDERNIYKFGMGANTQGLKDTNATTNLAIQTAYALLDIKADMVIRRFKAFLKKIIKVIIDEINATETTGYTVSDVKFRFEPSTLVNETENIQNEKTKAETKQIELNNILNIAAQIGDDKVLEAICEVMDWDIDKIKTALATASPEGISLGDAQNALNNAPVDGQQIDSGAVKEEAEEEIGQPLNGAQTASLLSIISQYKAGSLTASEAVSIISLSIGITEKKARKLLQLDSAQNNGGGVVEQ